MYLYWLMAMLISLALGAYYWDYLPPRTARKIAAQISGMPIPWNSEVVYYNERWTGFNNGYCRVALKLPPQAYQRLKDHTDKRTYKPVNPQLLSGYQSLPVAINTSRSIYRYGPKGEYGDFSTIILDDEQRLLITCLDYY